MGGSTNVDSERLFVQSALFKFDSDFAGYILGSGPFRRHRAAQQRNAGPGTFANTGSELTAAEPKSHVGSSFCGSGSG